ncbi:MAG: Bpu10I family restriction endonuclease [Rhodobacter sp.]|nr:Bpu10I family restriction endonuclease [Rhodobacter sp.]MCA3524057.1 Bpu10I family restriction endonuclease [Rhodobacter sp.]MCA3526840.1 Bpu10I family restriction endonuclease [Rhodobacter sp.]MCA3536034.1 Bpu10I family restriction endonuclease [Rhodobacter sp.]MCA3544619.1 Bpu10I family restriction endonuclease [Rhodobacter sp.]
MTPITTKLTSIDEVIVLRKAKRLGSNVRAEFSSAKGRQASLAKYEEFLDKNPIQAECVRRFIWHLNECFPEKEEDAEDVVLDRGYF